MDSREKLIIKEQFVGIAQWQTLQTRFNIDIDRRVTKHDKEIMSLKKESKSNNVAIKSLQKYFNK